MPVRASITAAAFAAIAAVAHAAPAPGQVGSAVPLAVAAGAPQHTAGVFKAGDGADRGQALLTETPTGVLINLKLTGLPPGWHAIHLHAKGDCSDAAFERAGGHINHATPKPHGLLNPQGPDFGDLPNIYAAADGTVNAELFTQLVSLRGAGSRERLLDADGSSIVVHANRDDYRTQPIGGAGARIACAVVKE
jgi:Cu-Zn family superoxide dismutase